MGRKRPGDILRALRPKFDEVRERARGLSRTSQLALAGAGGALGLSALAIAAIAALRQTNNRSSRSMQEMTTVELLGLYDKAPQFGTQSKSGMGQGTESEGAEPAPTKDGIARFCVSRVHELRELVEQSSSALALAALALAVLQHILEQKEEEAAVADRSRALSAQIEFLSALSAIEPTGSAAYGATSSMPSSPSILAPVGTEPRGRVTGTLKKAVEETRKGVHPKYGHIATWDVRDVTDMNKAFGRESTCPSASDLADLTFWDTRQVTDMGHACSSPTFNGKIWTWHTKMVTNMSSMFWFASQFNQDIGSWNTGKVKDMSDMFRLAEQFNQDIGSWNTSNVENMSGMLAYAYAFDQDIGSWNTGNVEDMSKMFEYAEKFDNGGAELSWNVGKVKDMKSMFSRAAAFDRDISGWSVRNVNTDDMFIRAPKFSHAAAIFTKWKLTAEQSAKTGFPKYGGRAFV